MNNSTQAYLKLTIQIKMSSKLQLNLFKTASSHLKKNFFQCLRDSGEASPTIYSCYANFAVFIDYKRNQFPKK